jgi:hypothetical protein
MFWNYFATRHGKGETDGASSLLERELHKEQIKTQGFKIQNANEAISQQVPSSSSKYIENY